MSATNKIQIMAIDELADYIASESKRHAPIIVAPPLDIFGQTVKDRTRDLCKVTKIILNFVCKTKDNVWFLNICNKENYLSELIALPLERIQTTHFN